MLVYLTSSDMFWLTILAGRPAFSAAIFSRIIMCSRADSILPASTLAAAFFRISDMTRCLSLTIFLNQLCFDHHQKLSCGVGEMVVRSMISAVSWSNSRKKLRGASTNGTGSSGAPSGIELGVVLSSSSSCGVIADSS